ncbi:DUF4342 domain-containing protein [Ornithinimicrobium sufpigmenti]|uniref:DUF4342 domain-containing protein n=1 Tax=Ornithinimicrobium sufpigmenti TaxID=2508882 RepID=UPI0015E17CD8|nr:MULTISPECIES: DUF4342 domain-containing protein [unclassified Ornithinimicrobium]
MDQQSGRTFTERFETTGAELTERVKELAREADTRRVVIKDQDGKELMSVPLTWGMAGGALAVVASPLLAAVAAVGGAMAKVRLEVERVSPQGSPWATVQGQTVQGGAAQQTAGPAGAGGWVEDDPDWTPPDTHGTPPQAQPQGGTSGDADLDSDDDGTPPIPTPS